MSRSRRVHGALGVGLLVAALGAGLPLAGAGDDPARSVILVVGDGMGAAHREAARLALVGPERRLGMDELPVLGLQSTTPFDPDATVTDSAAAATAWATGSATVNGAISVGPDGRPRTPLGRLAAEAGKATGIVTTSTVTDATPAAFFASVPRRDRQRTIAEQYLERGLPDVVLGGGRAQWLPAAGTDRSDADAPAGASAAASRPDLLAGARQRGYAVVDDRDSLAGVQAERVVGLFTEREMWKGEGTEVTLAEMTRAALDVLSRDEDGFFLLVEEEEIDARSHANEGEEMLEAMQSLEHAVRVAREFAAEHPDTLLVVTGDHDAGGLTIEDWEGGEDQGQDGPFRVAARARTFALDWTTDSHTGVPTPVTAQGPGSERLAGSYPNTHLHDVLRSALLGD